ncbi:uncharacterized protein LOC129584473 [Paramacrobiotus metropolitanus]|uniref:uncharacterized protein LOC129584473 n=1 Tax=Paramacrobiotus metropolitanus TaxID=2943436 RepID=UPI002445DBDE|nr:uncharacterized protein LOC129584473 [Paramacrobiotus metropolitanus]
MSGKILMILLSVSTSAFCLELCPHDLVSITCEKSRAIANFRFDALVAPESPWKEFSGMNLFSSLIDFNSSTFLPLELHFEEQRLSRSLTYEDFLREETNTTTTLNKQLTLEMVWPVKDDGSIYRWPFSVECGFKNTVEQESARLSFHGGADYGNAITLEIDGGADAVIPPGQRVHLTVEIPADLHAVPDTCILMPGDADVDLSHGLAETNACFLVKDRMKSSENCTMTGADPVVLNVKSNVTSNETLSKAVLLEWNSFLYPNSSGVFTVICAMRICNFADNTICNLDGFNSPEENDTSMEKLNIDLRVDIFNETWIYYVTKSYNIRLPTTTETTSSTVTTTSATISTGTPVPVRPGARNENDICLPPAEMWSIVTVPFGLIIIALGLLIFLNVKLNKSTKRKALDSVPRVSVTTEPVLFRRPHLVQGQGRQRRDREY